MSKQVISSFKGFKASVKSLEALTAREVRVGVLDSSPHGDDGITNAQLLAIHEFGARSKGIPERSVLRTTTAESRAEVAEILRDGMAAPRAALNAAGALLKTRIRAKFGSARLRRAKQPDTNGPLYDTGKLKRAIRHKVYAVGGDK